VKRTLTLGALSVANIAGFALFQLAVVAHFGPGAVSDAFFASLTLPQLFMAVVGGALNSALVPMFSGEATTKQDEDVCTLIASLGGGLLLLAIVAAFAAPLWVPWLVPGFSGSALAQTISFSRLSVFALVLTGVNFIQAALAQARGQVIALECTLAFPTLIATAVLVLLMPHFGAACVMWAFMLRPTLQFFAMIILNQRPVAPNFKTGVVGETWRRVRPILFASSYYKLDPVVDRALLSWALPGSMSLFLIVQQVHSACSQVVAKMMVSPAFGPLAEEFKYAAPIVFWRRFNRLIKVTAGLALAVALAVPLAFAAMMVITGWPIPGFAGRSWELLTIYGLSVGMLLIGAVGAVTSTAFYARQQPGLLAKLASIAFTLGAVIKVGLFYMFGIKGLAFGVSCYLALSLALQWRALSNMQKADLAAP
jgi:putative peptidoglycan lipid II flippase